MTKINFLTVCTDKYPIFYAEKITKQFIRSSKLNIIPYCLTDRPQLVSDWAKPLNLAVKTQGWWNKLNLYNPYNPDGWNLYMDLDIVIQDTFDNEIEWVIQHEPSIACVSDAINWMGEKFSSSFMIFKTNSQKHIFERFIKEHDDICNLPGGDQVWTGPQLKNILYIDEKFPNLKKNLKFDIAIKNGDKLSLPGTIDSTIKLVDCGGRPKPHDLHMLPYIKRNWHDIICENQNL